MSSGNNNDVVYFASGDTCRFAQAVLKFQYFVESYAHAHNTPRYLSDVYVTSHDILEHFRLDIFDHRNHHFRRRIADNPHLRVIDQDGSFSVRHRPKMDIHNREQLGGLFSHRLPGGLERVDGHSRDALIGVHEDDIKDAYPSISMDLDDMVQAGEVCCLQDKPPRGVGKRIFFPAPHGSPFGAPSLYHSIKFEDQAEVPGVSTKKRRRGQKYRLSIQAAAGRKKPQ